MAKISTSISIDSQLKTSAQQLFDELGLDFSGAVTLFLKQAVREQAIPFKIQKNTLNTTTIEALNEYYDMKNNKDAYKRYSSFSDIMKDIQ